MKSLTRLFVLFTLISLMACNASDSGDGDYDRPYDTWVFRSVLDQRPRILSIALHKNLWLAYNAQTGALYRAWKGGVDLVGAVYNTAHGPQPISIGDAFFVNTKEDPWTVVRNGKEEKPKIQYRGHRFNKGQVSVQSELMLDDGTVVRVRETPEYITNTFGQTGLERLFSVENLPAGAQLVLHSEISSLPTSANLQSDGALTFNPGEPLMEGDFAAVQGDFKLVLNQEGVTRLTAFFTKFPMIENTNTQAEEEEDRPLGAQLMDKTDCRTCHNTFVQTIGPSYVDIAKKYRNTPANTATLIRKVKTGGSGVWGQTAMTPHPELTDEELQAMIGYVMDLDAEEEAKLAAIESGPALTDLDFKPATTGLNPDDIFPGAIYRLFVHTKRLYSLADADLAATPAAAGIIPIVVATDADLQELPDNSAIEVKGFIKIPKSNNYTFRLVSDDGSRLFIGDQEVVNHDGEHGADPKDGDIALAEGYHPFTIRYFQSLGGRSLALLWKPYGSEDYEPVPESVLFHDSKDRPDGVGAMAMGTQTRVPGDGVPLDGVHPSYDLSQARPDDFVKKIGGLDFMSDGRMVVSVWDSEGGVYILDGVDTGDPSRIKYKRIAQGLAEPLGLKVVDDEIYVLQKHELTKLVDHDGDEIIDEYYTLCNEWRVSANFHEFAFGLAFKEGYFYAALAIAILPGGASANPQIPDRGKAIRISKETGRLEFVAEGLRTPNGVGIGADGEIFIADNQGDWLPSSKILHVTRGAFFGSRAVDSARVANFPVKQPVVWLPQDEIGNSPSTPLALNDGPYKGQMIHGEVTHGGVKRVFVEKVDGEFQGVVFRFTQGLEAGVNRMAWGPDGALYMGGVGNPGNWSHSGKHWYGLQRLKYNGKPTFEMLAVRAKSNGMEIELTQPLAEGFGSSPDEYEIQQWRYQPTANYGGPKLDLTPMRPKTVHISADRKKIFLELDGLLEEHVVYLHLPYSWTNTEDEPIWSTEAWYTLNRIPENQPGFNNPAPPPPAPNSLTETERAAGWKLLFDGQTTNGWHSFNKPAAGPGWKVKDGALGLEKSNPQEEGGDLVTSEEFENFDLRLEWKISACGNSGLMFNVVEDPKYCCPWHTGPELQILDNTCHPDARIPTHRASDLYDMITSQPETVKPAGQWNRVRLVVKDGKAEHWLNGRKVLTFELFNQEWTDRIADSKFKDMPDFGKSRKGKIAVQDHGDRVWFRNVKIREY